MFYCLLLLLLFSDVDGGGETLTVAVEVDAVSLPFDPSETTDMTECYTSVLLFFDFEHRPESWLS